MKFDPAAILQVLARHRVDHIVIGGIGGVLHGSPMSTGDLDVVPALKQSNLTALAEALRELNARLLSHEVPEGIAVDWAPKDLHRWIIDFRFLNLMTDYGQLDLVHRPAGTGGYRDLTANAETMDLGDVAVRVASLEDIIRSKGAVARQRDLEQLPTLRLVLEAKEDRG